jgi:hypothetical protein
MGGGFNCPGQHQSVLANVVLVCGSGALPNRSGEPTFVVAAHPTEEAMTEHMNEPWLVEEQDQQYMEAGKEEEHMILEALAECARAGSPPDAVELLAHELGVAREYERMRP